MISPDKSVEFAKPGVPREEPIRRAQPLIPPRPIRRENPEPLKQPGTPVITPEKVPVPAR